MAPACCPICLDFFKENDQVMCLPMCAHMFHIGCIVNWFNASKVTCPMCRIYVRKAMLEDFYEKEVSFGEKLDMSQFSFA